VKADHAIDLGLADAPRTGEAWTSHAGLDEAAGERRAKGAKKQGEVRDD
jgi:hypothetical protein